MSKSSFLINKKVERVDIAIICILLMVVGLLRSRLFLSLGMVGLGVTGLWGVSPKEWLRDKWWLLGLGWVAMYAISGFWSDNKEEWSVFLQLKLPVVLLPVAFRFLPSFSAKQLQLLTLAMGLLLLGGAFYSVSFLVMDYDFYVKQYNVSHLIPTPVYNDYICFSMSCALYIVWAMYRLPGLLSRSAQWGTAVIAALLAVYLHILASKSGLIALYIFAFSAALYGIIARRNKAAMLSLLAIPVVLYLGVTYVPTLKERKEHIIYTWYRYMDHDRTGKLGDLSRLISYEISLKLIAEHPITGTGTGDMLAEMNKGYDKWYPAVTDERNRLIPHNQFLTIALGCGIPAMLLFLWWVVMPLFQMPKGRARLFFVATWLALFVQLMIEPFLEGQFGVFIYLFFPLMIMHCMPNETKRMSL